MMHKSKFEEGQGLAEYSFLFIFVALLLIVLVFIFGEQVRTTYQDIINIIEAYIVF